MLRFVTPRLQLSDASDHRMPDDLRTPDELQSSEYVTTEWWDPNTWLP